MSERIEKTGGCQCGAVRYRATIDPEQAYLCHCRMCQRATGGVAAAFINLTSNDIEWESGPDWYASSPIARRPFCSNCGSPLGFSFNDSEHMDITVGSLDDPYGIAPHWHFSSETIHEEWIDMSKLPRKKIADYEALNQKWIEATGSVPK